MARDEIQFGEKFHLKTCGNSMNVTLGVPNTKSKRSSLEKLSFEVIKELSDTLDLSGNGTNILCSQLRKSLGKNMVESNISSKLTDLQQSLDKFYDVKEELFISANDGEIKASIIIIHYNNFR